MSRPRVSICVPNLNNRPFLEERFETILAQTEEDWELLVYDGYSDDGAWEFITQLAARVPRMRAWQGPREGLLGCWTPCARAARGEYVYIATSDDTMPAGFLRTMADALDAHPACDLAHAPLRVVDGRGEDLAPMNEWWAQRSVFARSSGEMASRRHIRRAPLDGLLHLAGMTVTVSVTQLVIRRRLFEKTGWFTSRWGSVGDFNWDMRAGLVANTIHVPETWGGWRIHAAQATNAGRSRTPEHLAAIEEMIDDACEACRDRMDVGMARRLARTWAPRARGFRALQRVFETCPGYLPRQLVVAGGLASGSAAAWHHLRCKLRGGVPWPDAAPEIIRGWLEKELGGPALVPAE